MSILCFYLRVFSKSKFRHTVLACMALNLLCGIAFLLADVLQCSPPWLFWSGEPERHGSRCVKISIITWCHAAVNITLDLVTLAIALWMVQGLAMRRRQKAYVIAMFALGSAITLISILRLQAIPRIEDEGNRTWDWVPVTYWSGVEVIAGLCCACAPALKGLFPLFRGQDTTKPNSTSGYLRQSSLRKSRDPERYIRRAQPDPLETSFEFELSDRSSVLGLVDYKKTATP
ncbi:hypothetical protein GGR56DRAFT_659374 [Xylariaceae sp. FL0804]|nr:hypothetical protein GGR56DRAFT_659374 [Xylariaceae sp. FL0804]